MRAALRYVVSGTWFVGLDTDAVGVRPTYHEPHTTNRLGVPVEPGSGTAKRNSPGFTLIEILVVIAVIAILASLVSPMVFRNVGDAKQAAARAQIGIFGLALDAYRLDNGVYPSTEQGLAALRTAPSTSPEPANWRGPYLRKDTPLDPWGREYVYMSPGETNAGSYDLYTWGRDGELGGEDEDADVTSWQ